MTTFLSIITIFLALLALLLAWRAARRHKALDERISQANSRIYRARQELLQDQERMQAELTRLKFELLKSQGQLKITADMTVDEINLTHPLAGQVLAGFHLGGCSSCAVDGSERLDLALAASGQPVEPVLVALNHLLEENETGTVSPERLKRPNVELTV